MGKKKHKIIRKHQNDPGDCLSSGEEETQRDCVNVCRHLSKSVNLGRVRKILKSNVSVGGCKDCLKSEVTEPTNEEVEATRWLCLQCGNIGCGRYSPGQHALKHFEIPRSDSHATCLNISTWSVWCYECDEDVLPDSNKKLLECVEFLRRHLKPYTALSSSPVSNKSFLQSGDLNPESNCQARQAKANRNDAADNIDYRSLQKQEPKKLLNGVSCAQPKGLSNLGNTCFFNAVMQSLSQTHMLPQLLEAHCVSLKSLALKVPQPKEVANGLELVDLTVPLSEGGMLTQSLISFLKEMHLLGGRSKTVTPGHLFGQLCAKAPQFKGMMQQDSHELLRHLLDGLKNEEIQRYQLGILKALGLGEKSSRKKIDDATRAKVKAYGKLVQQTVVDCLFGGQLISTVLCEECKMSSQVLEPFLDLSLPVNEEKPVRPNVSRKSISDDDTTTTYLPRRDAVSDRPSKHQQKKTKKQARRDAKLERREARQTKKKEKEEAAAGAQTWADNDADSVTNSFDKNGSELSDADVEDNEESESVSSYTRPDQAASPAAAPSGAVGAHTEESKEEGENLERRCQSVDELCERVNDICVYGNGVDCSSSGDEKVPGVVVEKMEDDVTIEEEEEEEEEHQHHLANGNADEDEAQSEDEKEKEGGGRKSMAKQEWVTRSLTTLASRYHPSSLECSVMSCLSRFTASELLTGNNKFGCEKCTRRREEQEVDEEAQTSTSSTSETKKRRTVYTNASKQILVFSPPAILTLHLKRFQQVGFSLRKVNRHVDFSLVLDLAPYCSSLSAELPTLRSDQKRVLYSLYAVVEHSGRLSGGHYTAYVKVKPRCDSLATFLNDRTMDHGDIDRFMEEIGRKWQQQQQRNGHIDDAQEEEEEEKKAAEQELNESRSTAGTWYHISDGHVSESSQNSVLKCQAYLLFYERVL